MRLLTLLILSTSLIFCLDKGTYFASGKKLDLKHFVLPDEEDSLKVYVFFRISNDAQNFKNYGTEYEEIFKSQLELEITAKDESGIIRKRLPYSDTYEVESYEQTVSKNSFYYGFFEFKLFNRKHDLELTYSNGKSLEPVSIEFSQLEYDSEKKADLAPLFVYNYKKNRYSNLEFFITKSGFFFGQYSARVFLPVSGLESEELSFELTSIEIEQDDENENFFHWDNNIEISGNAELLNYKDLKFEKINQKILFSIDIASGGNQMIEIDLPVEKIVPGNYSLKILADGNEIFRNNFMVEWQNKPISLQNPDFAADKMYYILDDEAYENITDGSKKEKFRKILNYWRSKDPTPNTPFNESMNQYFSRVDFAFFNFSTLAEKDGAETDRGKIFILKGMPDKIYSIAEEGESYQIWEYKNLSERYKFKLVTSGVYLLVEINDLTEK